MKESLLLQTVSFIAFPRGFFLSQERKENENEGKMLLKNAEKLKFVPALRKWKSITLIYLSEMSEAKKRRFER